MSEGNQENSLDEWRVVCQNSSNALVLYSSALQQIRTVAEAKSTSSTVPWTSPKYFQILESFLSGSSHMQFNLNDFLMNGYFDRFFPIRQKIGSGGCGSVYRVEHVLAGIHLAVYAVKIIPVGEYSWLKRVINEVKLLEKLARTPHPLILGYKHCWIEEWQPANIGPKVPCLFILMEYASLGNVEKMITDGGLKEGTFKDLKTNEAWQIFLSIATAVHHLHSLGILHRDIKLSNVLVFDESGNRTWPIRLVLSDFGTALDLVEQQRKTRTGSTGTIETMAPELLVTDADGSFVYDHSFASDVWSLGVILFSLFYHCNPFIMKGGETRLQEYKSVENLIKELGLESVQVPPLAKKFIKKMMEPDPKMRCTLDDLMSNPEVYDLTVEFGLDNLVKSDGPSFGVSPSMEDFDSSVLFALPDGSKQNRETQTEFRTGKEEKSNFMSPRIVVTIVMASMSFVSVAFRILHVIICIVSVFGIDDDFHLCLAFITLSFIEAASGLAHVSIPLFVLLFYVLSSVAPNEEETKVRFDISQENPELLDYEKGSFNGSE